MSDQYEKAMKYYSWCLSCPSTHSENQQMYDEWAETYDKVNNFNDRGEVTDFFFYIFVIRIMEIHFL